MLLWHGWLFGAFEQCLCCYACAGLTSGRAWEACRAGMAAAKACAQTARQPILLVRVSCSGW